MFFQAQIELEPTYFPKERLFRGSEFILWILCGNKAPDHLLTTSSMDRHYFRSEQSLTFSTFYMRYGLLESGSVPIQWECYGESTHFAPPPGGNASPSKPAPIRYPNDSQATIYTSAWSESLPEEHNRHGSDPDRSFRSPEHCHLVLTMWAVVAATHRVYILNNIVKNWMSPKLSKQLSPM